MDEYSVLLAAGGKPSTWLPPGGLVEHLFLTMLDQKKYGNKKQKLSKLSENCWKIGGKNLQKVSKILGKSAENRENLG